MGKSYALYKRTFNGDGTLKDDELIGNFHEFNNAVATAALIVHNKVNECIGHYQAIPADSYSYLIYEMNEDGDINLNKPLYRTEIYVNV